MSAYMCVGEYAKTPIRIPNVDIDIYSCEELCVVMAENVFLLDFSLMNDNLLDWIDQECGLKELSRGLYSLVHRKGHLSTFVTMLMRYVGILNDETVDEVERILQNGAKLSGIEKKKNQIDFLMQKKKYKEAVSGYEMILKDWDDLVVDCDPVEANSLNAAILHNKGVALAGMYRFEEALEAFEKAYGLTGTKNYFRDFLAAKRMVLPEKDYVSFTSEIKEDYQIALELERDIDTLKEMWEKDSEAVRIERIKIDIEYRQMSEYEDDADSYIAYIKEKYAESNY